MGYFIAAIAILVVTGFVAVYLEDKQNDKH